MLRLLAFVPLLLATVVFAQEPVLLNDFTTSAVSTFNPNSSSRIEGIVMKPNRFSDATERLFFVADDGIHGEELWRSDGTEVGTQLVKDIYPGEESSSIRFLATVGNTVYFAATDGKHGRELWVSQGTAASTRMVVDLNEGSNNGVSPLSGTYVYFKDFLYFVGSGDKGFELYRTDGTAEGTTLVKDINPNLDSRGLPASGSPRSMTAATDIIYFIASDGEHGHELWRTDGTTAGTVLVEDINKGGESSDIFRMKTVENSLLFTADDGVNGRELWGSRGIENIAFLMTTNLPDRLRRGDIKILGMVGTDGSLYFTVREAIDKRLWKINTSSGNTELVEGFGDFGSFGSDVEGHIMYQDSLFFVESGSLWKADGTVEEQVTENISIDGFKLTILNDELYFIASQEGSNIGLWKTNGTTEGTRLVKEITSGSFRRISNLFITSLASGSDARLYFIAETDEFGREIWTSDGTEEGTFILMDFRPGEEDGLRSADHRNFQDVGGQLMFAGFDEVNGRELWKSNGTTEGTTLVKDINAQTEDVRLHSNPMSFQNKTFFATREGIWQTDGTNENTSLLQESEAAYGLQVFNNQLIYTDNHPDTNQRTIWLGDGTAEGSQPLLDSAEAANLIVSLARKQPQINGTLFISGQTSELGREMYKTDGTAEGTVLIKDINPGSEDSEAILVESRYFILNNTLYFQANNSLQGIELWKTDGTEAGTVPITDINPFGGSSPEQFLEINGTVFFRAGDGTSGRELWKTDGTTNGTVLVKDIRVGAGWGISGLAEFTNYQGTLFFIGTDEEHGQELWKSDGTEAGTVMVKDINPNTSNFSDLRGLTVYNDLLMFIATDSTGRKIWRSDGTEEGTQILIDIEAISGFVNANGTLFFTATDDEHGVELWRTDGTAEGTQLVQDIFAGTNNSLPILLDYINDALYFTALDESNGRELWALSPLRIQTELSASSGAVCSAEDSITFTASATDAGAEPTYQWYLNDQLLPDQSSSTYATAGFANGDEVKVQVVASKDVWVLDDSVFSEILTIDFSALKPDITVVNNTLTASEGDSYRWFLEGEALPDTTRAITAPKSGSYQVELTNKRGCSAISERIEVIVCTSNVPSIQVEGTTLTASEASSYQWFRDGEVLPDTTQSIGAEEAGSYEVEVTDASGCVSRSEAVEVEGTVTGLIDQRLAKELTMYPNPVTARLTIGSPLNEDLEVAIYSTTGQLKHQSTLSSRSSDYEITLDHLSPGLYLVRFTSRQGWYQHKLLKQ